MTEVWITETESFGAIPRSLLNLLDPSEEERSLRFRFGEDRRRFLLGRILLRMALSGVAGGNPRDWRLIIGKTGKVSLAHSPDLGSVDFSISHSRNAIAVAVSTQDRVGVDIERMDLGSRALDCAFNRNERAYLASRSEAERLSETIRLWTIKEAYAKLMGLGVGLEFSEIDVTRLENEGNLYLESHSMSLGAELYRITLAVQSTEQSEPATLFRVVDRSECFQAVAGLKSQSAFEMLKTTLELPEAPLTSSA